jgi:hypothetical protein
VDDAPYVWAGLTDVIAEAEALEAERAALIRRARGLGLSWADIATRLEADADDLRARYG